MQDCCRSSCLHFFPIPVRRHTLFSHWTKSRGLALFDRLWNRCTSCERRYLFRLLILQLQFLIFKKLFVNSLFLKIFSQDISSLAYPLLLVWP